MMMSVDDHRLLRLDTAHHLGNVLVTRQHVGIAGMLVEIAGRLVKAHFYQGAVVDGLKEFVGILEMGDAFGGAGRVFRKIIERLVMGLKVGRLRAALINDLALGGWALTIVLGRAQAPAYQAQVTLRALKLSPMVLAVCGGSGCSFGSARLLSLASGAMPARLKRRVHSVAA